MEQVNSPFQKRRLRVIQEVEEQADRLIVLGYHEVLSIPKGVFKDDVMAAIGGMPTELNSWKETKVLVVVPGITPQKQAEIAGFDFDYTAIPIRSSRDIARGIPLRRPYIIYCTSLGGDTHNNYRDFQGEIVRQKRRGLTLCEGLMLMSLYRRYDVDCLGFTSTTCTETVTGGAVPNIAVLQRVIEGRYLVTSSEASLRSKMQFPSTIKKSSY